MLALTAMAVSSSRLPDERTLLRAELLSVNAQIDAAYWLFCRCKRAKPPVLVVPEAYRRRTAIERRLRELR